MIFKKIIHPLPVQPPEPEESSTAEPEPETPPIQTITMSYRGKPLSEIPYRLPFKPE